MIAVRLRRAALVAGSALAAGCAAGCAIGRPPEVREIAVDLAVSRAEAVRRTHAVFREQGYAIRETRTSGTSPETEPFRHRGNADVVFRAAITGDTRRSHVVFSGTYRTRDLGGLVHGKERPVRRVDPDGDALERELWARLDNLAIMLRRRGG